MDLVTCCEWSQFPVGHGGSAERFGYHLPPLGEDGCRVCFGITHDCMTKTTLIRKCSCCSLEGWFHSYSKLNKRHPVKDIIYQSLYLMSCHSVYLHFKFVRYWSSVVSSNHSPSCPFHKLKLASFRPPVGSSAHRQ